MREASVKQNRADHADGGPAAMSGTSVAVGIQHGGVVAGRDIIFGGATEFFEPQLDDVKPPEYPTSTVALDLTDRLVNHRLLILGGHELLDRETLARHLAWLLKTRLEATSVIETSTVKIFQWSHDVDRGRLLGSLQRYEMPTVFLLPDARPAQFGFDVRQLRDDLTRAGHYAVLSSISAAGQWGIDTGNAADNWFGGASSEVFPAEDLIPLLEQRLEEASPSPADSRSLLHGIQPSEVVTRLETPNRIARFVHALVSSPTTLDTPSVRKTLEQFADSDVAIRRWYRALSRRHQLLAMGLVLFDGLYDDQIFAALEEIMTSVWKTWEPQLCQFDFRDLEEMRIYFPNAGKNRQITSRSEAVRQGILEMAWALHRRHLMAAVPVSIDLLKRAIRTTQRHSEGTEESTRTQKRSLFGRKKTATSGSTVGISKETLQSVVLSQKKAAERTETALALQSPALRARNQGAAEELAWDLEGHSLELWGSEVRIAMLRGATANMLSRLSRLSADGLDAHLRSLARHRLTALRVVAAEALANWRGVGRHAEGDKALHEKLHEWSDRTLKNDVDEWRVDRSDPEHRRSMGSVRATVAMAIGYASRYDPPDQMSSELLELFEQFLEERNPDVRAAFAEVTMPLAIGTHLVQLEPLLREGARQRRWLRRGLALGFVLALELRPDEALAVMDAWHAQCQPSEQEIQLQHHSTTRENVLAALIEAYSLFSSFSQFKLFGFEIVFSKFQRIMAEEKGEYLRRLTLWGALVQFRRRPVQAESLLQDLVTEATLEERRDLIQGLGFIFWDQRQELEGGDRTAVYHFSADAHWPAGESQPLAWDEIVIRGSREFAVWTRAQRPHTQIEQMMRRWLLDDEYPAAQQLAFETLADLNLKEKVLQWIARPPNARRDNHEQPPEIGSLKRVNKLPFIGRLITYLSVSEASGMRDHVLSVLPQLMRLGSTGFAVKQLLKAWKGDTDPRFTGLAVHLKVAATLYRWRHGLTVLLAAAAAVVYFWPEGS